MSDDDIFHRGLAFDLGTVMRRRRLLGLLAGVGAAGLVGCSAPDPTSPSAAGPSSSAAGTGNSPSAAATATSCAEIPEETAGPYPGDGSNGPDVLTQSGIVRSDIRSSFGTASRVAAGVPLTVNLTIVDTGKGCAAYTGAAVYLWHCDRDGAYSLYSPGVTAENYLRGVQAADSTGLVTFRSIFPGAYSGRWPHIHFEVYADLAGATSVRNKVATSQLALPQAVCQTVYATAGYTTSAGNLARSSLASDMVFGDDGGVHQLATVTGSVASGLVANLTVPV
jgi:protocatechuate 3,4-dioxygenase beta subunit